MDKVSVRRVRNAVSEVEVTYQTNCSFVFEISKASLKGAAVL